MSTETFRWEPEFKSFPLVTVHYNEDGTGNANLYLQTEDGNCQEIHGMPVEALQVLARTIPQNPPKIRCPYDCGGYGRSQGGTSYYACDKCGEEFDRDELDEFGQLKDEG